MASLHNLSTSHVATREFDIFIDKVTIRSFFSTLVGITLILLLTSLFFNGLTHSIPVPITHIESRNYKPIGKKSGEKATAESANTNHRQNGAIGSKAVNNFVKQDSTEHIESQQGDTDYPGGDSYGLGNSVNGLSQNSLYLGSSDIIESAPEEEGEEFTVIPDIEPLIDVDAIHRSVIYPEIARKLGKEGEVVLRVFISEKGTVAKIDVVSSTATIFEQSAIEALRNFSTNPAMNNGKPVQYAVYIPIKFRIR